MYPLKFPVFCHIAKYILQKEKKKDIAKSVFSHIVQPCCSHLKCTAKIIEKDGYACLLLPHELIIRTSRDVSIACTAVHPAQFMSLVKCLNKLY